MTPSCSGRTYPFGLILLGALGLAACREEDTVTDPGAGAPLMAEASAAPAFATLAAGRYYTCGLTSEGRAFCWGNNDAGQLGDGSTTARLRPVPVAGGLAFRAITAGAGHTCGVTTDSRLYCWGNGRYVGIASPPVRTDGPMAVAPSVRFQNVYAGFSHTCAITEGDRRAYCWGDGFAGELGDGSGDYRATPVAVAGGRQWRQLSIGYEFSCGITTGRKGFCWGKDNEGQLGNDAASAKKLTPVAVADDHVFEQIDSGMLHTCAVDAGAQIWCWGFGQQGQIGDGRLLRRYTPRAVAGTRQFGRVTAGTGHSCAETIDGLAFCWGDNTFGQLGTGTAGDSIPRPARVNGGFHFAQVTAGGDHTCGRSSAGVARCWGRNSDGQLGDGTTTNRPAPTLVAGPA